MSIIENFDVLSINLCITNSMAYLTHDLLSVIMVFMKSGLLFLESSMSWVYWYDPETKSFHHFPYNENPKRALNSILLNIMFHAPMGRFQLELIYYFTYFSTVVPSNICVFVSCRLFVVNTTFSTCWNELTTNGLQKRKTQTLDKTTEEK